MDYARTARLLRIKAAAEGVTEGERKAFEAKAAEFEAKANVNPHPTERIVTAPRPETPGQWTWATAAYYSKQDRVWDAQDTFSFMDESWSDPYEGRSDE